MLSNLKRPEYLLNLIIVIVFAVFLAVVVQKYFFSTPDFIAHRPPTGTKFVLDGVDFSKNRKSIVLALQRTCRFCSESIPFYQELVKVAEFRDDLGFLALMPGESDENQAYLESNSVLRFNLIQVKLEEVGMNATPTLLIVNDEGVVLGSWVGKLSPEVEKEVIFKLIS